MSPNQVEERRTTSEESITHQAVGREPPAVHARARSRRPGRYEPRGKLNEQLELFACRMHQGLLAASVAIGLDVMGELIEAEVTDIAGPKGKHDPDRSAYRHGTERGKVSLGGRRVPVCRPRVRTAAGDGGLVHEVHLESYDTFARVDLLASHMVKSLMAGLSGREYETALEPVGSEVEKTASGTKQSSVSASMTRAGISRWPST